MLALHRKLAAASIPADKKLYQRQIEATDCQIDALVYELCWLTEEEIAMIEEIAHQSSETASMTFASLGKRSKRPCLSVWDSSIAVASTERFVARSSSDRLSTVCVSVRHEIRCHDRCRSAGGIRG